LSRLLAHLHISKLLVRLDSLDIFRSGKFVARAISLVRRCSRGEKIRRLEREMARHTKPNGLLKKVERPAHRVIAKNRFAKLEIMDQVIQKLVGV
jgi:hypothetical protein